MQQTTIQFKEFLQENEQEQVNVKARLEKVVQVINKWLDSESEFYTRLLGQSISWRKGLRVGVVLPLLTIIVGVTGMEAPLASVTSLASAGWLVYRLNHQEKEGGEA